MSISAVVTRGFGSWGSISDVVLRGFGIGLVYADTTIAKVVFRNTAQKIVGVVEIGKVVKYNKQGKVIKR